MGKTPSPAQATSERAFIQDDLSIVDQRVSAESVTHTGRWSMRANRARLKLFIAAFRAFV